MNENYLKTAIKAARSAGDIIVKNLGSLSKTDIRTKKAFDFVTKVDRLSERVIINTLHKKFPEHDFLAEETERQKRKNPYCWIIDPLDGTTNYIHGYPMFSVSIALEHKNENNPPSKKGGMGVFSDEIILGVVFDPLKNEMFSAVKGHGAFLNNQKIKTSSINRPENSLIATGFPFRKKEMIDLYLKAFKDVFSEVSDIRRAGSAAIDFAYIAAGRFEGFFELNLSPWDMAAGSLLIKEAGGVVTDFRGGDKYLSTGNIVAGNKYAHGRILKIIKKIFRGMA